jgi:hypothetical protein
VLLAIAELLLTWVATTGAEANPSVIRALRMVRLLRVLRTLRVVRMARGLRMLLMMLLYALPTLGNICGLYLIVNCVYALLAMQLFGNVSLDLSVAAGERPGTRAHFCTFGDAFLTLFECATGESWTALMHDQARSTWLAIPFFISYVILSTFIIFKMCIVLIIENFNLALKRDRHGLQPESADVFQDVWSQFDPEATGRMHVEYLIDFLRLLPPPLGLEPSEYPAGYVSAADVTRYAYMMSTIIASGRNVLFAGDTGVGKSVIVNDALLRMTTGTEPKFVTTTVNFSAQTQSYNLQEVLETKLDKKRKNR